MKIYLFNPETGIYLGEDFADEVPMKRGSFEIPPDATMIAPPRVEPGQITIFNRQAQCWDVHGTRILAGDLFYDKVNQNIRRSVRDEHV